MRRFEFEEGGSSKFWEVAVEGSAMTVRYGRIGTEGQTKTKSFPSGEAAQKEADKLVLEKTKKGYAEVGAASAAPAKAAAVAKPAAAAKAATAQPAAAAPEPAVAAPTAAPAASADRGESVVVDGEPVYFAPPAWAIAEAEVSVETPARARKVPSFEETWKHVIADAVRWASPSHYNRWPDASSGLSAADLGLVERARARLESKSEGEGLDPELEAFTLSLAILVPSYQSGDDPRAQAQRALAHWTARSDAATAARVLIRAERIGPADYGVRPAVIRPMPYDPPGFDGARAYALREHVRQHGRAALEAVIREELAPTTAARRAARAWILDDEAEATLALAEARTAGHVGHAWLVMGLVPDAADAAALVHSAPREDLLLRAILRHRLALAETVLTRARHSSAGRQWIYALACYPSLPTARALVEFLENKTDRKLVGEALANMPAEAIVALTEARAKKTKYRDAIDALLSTLSATSGSASTTEESTAEEAPLDALPPVFRAPPWRAKKRASAQVSIDGLAPRAIDPVVDLSSLDAQQLAREVAACTRYGTRGNAEQILARLGRGERVDTSCVLPLPVADLERLRDAGAFAKMTAEYWTHDSWTPGLTAILAQHGVAALPALLALVPHLSTKLGSELAYAGAVEIAPLATQWLGTKATRKAAEQWARRFPHHAAAGLVPLALASGTSSKQVTERDRAAFLLASIARAGHRDVVLEEARHHGAEAAAAITALLDRDPLELAPSKPPKLPDGLENLPRVALRDGRVMPREAATILAEMLAFSPLDPPYAGLEQTKDACDPRSLDAFVEALVRTFVANGMPSAHEWMVRAVALIGTDGAARFLFDRGRAWATDNQKQRAMLALDVLGAMGTDLALSLVGRVSRSAQRQYMKDRAVQILAEIAASRGLTPDELEDRTAPDLELDERGTMVLDFGPRSFRVGFDEHLRPFVQTSEGERLDALPRATKSDDAARAKAASEAWKTLKSEAEKVAKDQIARLERMMADERRVEADVFRSAFVEHPLIGHLARRLVWGAWDERGALLATFRVAEDRSLATVDDEPYELPDTARVGVVHPYALRDDGELVARWGQQLSDYAIIQPFAQLSRPVIDVAPDTVLSRYAQKKAYTGVLYGLRTAGWRSDVGEYGDIQGFTRELGGRRYYLSISPSIEQGKPSREHTISLSSSHTQGAPEPTPIQLSELVFQLDAVVAS